MKITDTINIAVADTSIIIRSGIASMLKRLPDITIHPVEVTSRKALQDIMAGHKPHILMVNPLFEGWFDVDEYRKIYKDIKIIAIITTMSDEGLLNHYDDKIELYDETDTVRDMIKNTLEIRDHDEPELPTEREKEVIACIVKGMTNKEIAEHLYLSVHTVITHRRNVTRKLDIHSVSGLTIYAIVNKIVDISDVKM